MTDNPTEDRIEIHWVYKPTDFFDEKIELPRGEYTFEIEGGRVTAKMSAVFYQPGPDFRKALNDELEDYFRLWQLHTRKTFELRKGGVDRIRPDGTKESTLAVDGIKVTVSVGSLNVITVGPDGVVHDARKEQFEARKKLVEAKLPLSSDPDARRMLESYDGSITTPGEELVYLYEIWDALMEKFKGRTAAQSALNISPATIVRFDELTCNLPLKQGRHRGRHDVLRDATPGELEEARRIAREMIERYFQYLEGQSNPTKI
jgi:hypothetical protein